MATLAELGVTVRPVRHLPPAPMPLSRTDRLWSRIAAEIMKYPQGSWVAISGADARLGGAYGAGALVMACRRAGFRVAVRQRRDALYVLRGRPLTGPDD